MSTERILLVVGLALLAAAAFVGFKQHRERKRPEQFARWRVVHAGGTSGGVQLIALATAFSHFGVHGSLASSVGAGIALATWAFFFGTAAHALTWPRAASLFNTLGGAIAIPAYLALPFVAL